MMPEIKNTLPERREYYRIDESIMTCYFILGSKSSNDQKAQHQAMELLDKLSAMTGHLKMSLSRMHTRLPELSNCFKILDTKVNLIAQTVVLNNQKNDLKLRKVNISAGGISFCVDEKVACDTILIVQMILPPELNVLSLKAKVIKCKKLSDKALTYFISTQFHNISDVTEDVIIRHIMHGQSDQLRAKKES